MLRISLVILLFIAAALLCYPATVAMHNVFYSHSHRIQLAADSR